MTYPFIEPCIFCDTLHTPELKWAELSYVTCWHCSHEGPQRSTVEAAIVDWNESIRIERDRRQARALLQRVVAALYAVNAVEEPGIATYKVLNLLPEIHELLACEPY